MVALCHGSPGERYTCQWFWALEEFWEAYRGAPVMVGNVLGTLMQVIRVKVPEISREQFEIDYADAISSSIELRTKTYELEWLEPAAYVSTWPG